MGCFWLFFGFPHVSGRFKVVGWLGNLKRRKKCCLLHDRETISCLVRKLGIIGEWSQDVMRYSYISYRIARG
jgi:Zn-finger protein